MKDMQPINESKRLSWIDAARGLAIFGIFMVNMPAFNAPFFMYGGEEKYWPSETSHTIQTIIDIFFQASFYTLFSFLFGFGLYMMKERLEEKGLQYRPVLFRRLFVLIAFGAIHALVIWHGDILFSYGVLGLLLFLFFERKPKTIMFWGVLILILAARYYAMVYFELREYLGTPREAEIAQAMQAYGEGSLLDIWSQNFHDWSRGVDSLRSWIWSATMLVPMFLLGIYFAKKKWLHNPDQYGTALKVTWWISLPLFIFLKADPHLYGNPDWMQATLQDRIGGSASALFYVTSVALLYKKKSKLLYLLKPFTYVGRLSLSNYLLQSIICFFLFYSVGLGYYGEVSPLWSVILVVLIYSLQVVGSLLWIRKFRYGPFEWLWRSLTYMSLQPMRRSTKKEEKATSPS